MDIISLITKIIVLYVIVILVLLIVALFVKKSFKKLSNNVILDNIILIILNLGLIYPIMFMINIYFPLLLILIVLIVFMVWIVVIASLKESLGLAYFVLTLISVVLAYITPILIKKLFSLNVKAFNIEYMKNLELNYSKYLTSDLLRGLTYVILLAIYICKNYITFNSGSPNVIIAVSSEALLTFVIIDTIIQIFKNLKVNKIKEKD